MKKRLLSILLVFIITMCMVPVYAETKEERLEYNEKLYAKYSDYPAVLEYYLREDNAAWGWKTPEFISLAEKITTGCTTEYQKAKAIHDWVANNLWYGYKPTEKTYNSSVERILDTRTGKCGEYSTLTIALLRAVGIPARMETGGVTDVAYGPHAWVFAYVDKRWIFIDTTWDSFNKYDNGYSPQKQCNSNYFDSSLKLISSSRRLMPWLIIYDKPDEDIFATNIVISEGYTEIAENEFYNNHYIERIVLPKTMNDIRSGFKGCANLKEVVIPEGDLKSIGSNAFYMCTSLPEVNIPSSITSIGSNAFSGCDSLTKVIIPPTVTEIADDAFGVVEFGVFKYLNGRLTSQHEKHYPKDLVIYGKENSYAHQYALKHNIIFNAIEVE